MSSACNASFLTSKWKVPSFFLFLPRWHPLSPFRHHQKAEQDAENLKNGPLWTVRGSADTIKEWYRLQIMHVSSLILVLSEWNGTVQRCTDAPQRPCMLNGSHSPRTSPHQRDGEERIQIRACHIIPTLKPLNNYRNNWDKSTAQANHIVSLLYSILWLSLLLCCVKGGYVMSQSIKWTDIAESSSVSITLPLVISMSLFMTAEIKDRRDAGSH